MGRSIYYGQNYTGRILGLSSYAEGVRLGPHVSGIDELLDGAEIEHIEHPTFVPSDVFELMLGAFVAKPGRTTLFIIREFYEVARWRCSSVCGSLLRTSTPRSGQRTGHHRRRQRQGPSESTPSL